MKLLNLSEMERLRKAVRHECELTKERYGEQYLEITNNLLENLNVAIELNCKLNHLDHHLATRAFFDTIARIEARTQEICGNMVAASKGHN